MASGPGRTSVRDRLHMSLIPPPLPHRRVQAPRRAPAAGTAAAPADRRKRSSSSRGSSWCPPGSRRWSAIFPWRFSGRSFSAVRWCGGKGPLPGHCQPCRQAGGQGFSDNCAGQEAQRKHQRQLPQGVQEPGVCKTAVPQACVVHLHGQHHEKGHQQTEDHFLYSCFWHDDRNTPCPEQKKRAQPIAP